MLSERTLRLVLIAVGAFHAATGLLALVAPGTFFDEIGRYGVENDHYVGDVGAFQLAAGVALLVAAGRASWRVPVLGLLAIWYGLHALNHAFDTDEARSEARGWVDTLLIALGAFTAAYLARIADRLGGAGAPAHRAPHGRDVSGGGPV